MVLKLTSGETPMTFSVVVKNKAVRWVKASWTRLNMSLKGTGKLGPELLPNRAKIGLQTEK
jgi:hypothetical protein